MAKWRVRGLVAGPALPSSSLKLGRLCTIKRATNGESEALLDTARRLLVSPDVTRGQFGNPDVCSVDQPLMTQVYSRHELSVMVEAENYPLAFREAERKAGRALAMLTVAVDTQRYRFLPVVANKLPGPAGIDTSNYSTAGFGATTVYEKDVLRSVAMDYAKDLVALSERDKVFATALGFLQAAWRLGEIPFALPEIHKAVLSNCFLVLEAISNAVTKEWKKRNRADTARTKEEITNSLAVQLARTEDGTAKVKAVGEAHRQMQRADLAFQSLKIEAAGRALEVEDRFVALAGELNDLRNRKLGHGGTVQEEDLDEWIFKSDDPRFAGDPGHFGKAERTAMAYLDAYALSALGR